MRRWRHRLQLYARAMPATTLATVALCLGALTWLYIRSEAVSAEQHFAYTQDLRDLRELHARITVELLAAQSGRVRNYDAVTAYIQQGQQTVRRALDAPAYLAQEDRVQVAQAAQALQKTFEQNAELVDHFKRNNAVLQNSLAIFPLLSAEFLDDHQHTIVPQRLLRAVGSYTRAVFSFGQRHGDAGLGDIEVARQRLAAEPKDPLQAPAVKIIVQHGETLVARMTALTGLMQEFAAHDADRQLDQLNQAYFGGYAHASALAARFRIALYCTAVLLTAFLALLFARLERIRRSLAHANREITGRYQAQLVVEKQLNLHAAAFRNAHDGITLTDARGNILDVNPAFTRITGWERSEVIGRNPRVLKSGKHDNAFYAVMWKSIEDTGNWQGEIWNRNKYGEVYPELLSISAIRDAGGGVTNYVAVFADIGRLKAQETQLKQLAYFDALTGLPNRVLLGDRLLQGIAQARRTQTLMAICYLDLDGFKRINDSWGHEVGDKVLVEMANRMKLILRGGDTVARLGGDEFVVLLLGLNTPSECKEAITRLLQQIVLPLTLLPEPLCLSASAGVALFPLDDEDPDTLLRHADQAMYRSKMAGKNMAHIFDAEEDRFARSRYDHVARLRRALEDQEFLLYYQPKVNMRLGKVTGMEALIRWNHPERGVLQPLDFLPLIETDDLIVQVGDWVIATAFQQMRVWRDAGVELAVSVNVAGKQLQAPDFVQKLRTLCAGEPVLCRLLELEILETAALEDIVQTTRVIDACQEMGLNFSLDDFGTGYSSLTYLRRLPAKTIKIDQSFVREILNDHNNLLIVQAVIGLASAFQLQVIAEGVETADHGRLLMQLNCDHAQGYGIARPMPAQAVLPWVRTWQPDPGWSAIQALYWSDADYPMLIAEVQLRNWFAQLLHALAQSPPTLGPRGDAVQDSHFHAWYSGAGRSRLAHCPAYANLGALIVRLAQQTAQITALCNSGQLDDLRALVPGLLHIREEFLLELHALQMEVAVR